MKVLITSRGRTNLSALIGPFLGGLEFLQCDGPPVRGCAQVRHMDRHQIGADIELGDEQTLGVRFIDTTKLTAEEVKNQLLELLPKQDKSPSLVEMIKSFSGDMAKWRAAKFPMSSKEEIDARLSICKSCQWWDSQAYNGTGRCKKCGCSTYAKIRLRTAKCPIDLWPRLDVDKT